MTYTHVFKKLSTAERLFPRGSKMVVPKNLRNQVVTLAPNNNDILIYDKKLTGKTTRSVKET